MPVLRPIGDMPIPEMSALLLEIVIIWENSARSVYYAEVTDELLPRMPPPISDISRPFWTGGADRSLLILWCQSCRQWVHPPAGECPTCQGELVPRPVTGRGTVFTFTVNHHPYNPEVPLPYVIAIVELDEQVGLRFTTNIVDCEVDDVHIGMAVEVTFAQAGEAWVPLFRPAPSDATVGAPVG